MNSSNKVNLYESNSQSSESNPIPVPAKRRRKKRRFVVFSLIVTVLVFTYLFEHISVGDVVRVLSGAHLPGLLMFVALSFVTSCFRAWRYLILLKLSGYSPNLFVLYLTVLVGNFFSDLLPARIGSLIYVFLSTKRLGIPFAASASSFAISFLFDLLSLAPLVLIIAIGVHSAGNLSMGLVLTSSLVVMLASVALLGTLPRLCALMAQWSQRLPLLSASSKKRVQEEVHQIRVEIETTARAGVYKRLFVLSCVIRILKYGSQYFVLYGLLLPLGYTLAELNVFEVFLGICASETAASMPFAGIGGFGLFEGTWALVFQLLGYPGSIAKVTSISLHIFVQVYGYVLGAIALGVLFLPLFKAKGVSQARQFAQESSLAFYTRLFVFCLLASLGVYLFVREEE